MPPSRTLKLNPFITIWVEWVEKIGPKVWRQVSEEYLEALYASWLRRMEALVAVGGSHTKYWRIFDYFVTTLWINELFAQVTEYSFYVFPFFGQWLQRGQWPMPSDIGGFFPSPPPSSPSSCSSPSIPPLPWLKAHIQAWRLKSHPAENPPMCCPSYSHLYHHKLQRGNGNRWPSTLVWLFYLLSFFNKNS